MGREAGPGKAGTHMAAVSTATGFLPGAAGFVVIPRRWIVERTLGWLGRWRRLSKDYEELPEVSEAMVTLAAIRIMLQRLVHPNRKRLPTP
jgi:putative transposase